MKICGRDYKLTFRKGQKGASFFCNGRKSEGRGEISIGLYKDLRGRAEILCHEIIEAILVEDGKRLCQTGFEESNKSYRFHFDHDYLDGLSPKILDALLTSGMFQLRNIKPNKARQRSKEKRISEALKGKKR
jgi:hypothetical protein